MPLSTVRRPTQRRAGKAVYRAAVHSEWWLGPRPPKTRLGHCPGARPPTWLRDGRALFDLLHYGFPLLRFADPGVAPASERCVHLASTTELHTSISIRRMVNSGSGSVRRTEP